MPTLAPGWAPDDGGGETVFGADTATATGDTTETILKPPAGSDADQTALPGTTRPPASETGPLVPGQTFGPRYHIIKLIGLGGMGAVYQAWDAELGVVVALKVIRPEAAADPEAARDLERRFKRELLLARQVTHRNVVRIHDLGEIGGIKYITMPFVDGSDLATVLAAEGHLPVPRVIRIARTALSGLAAAHQAGVVHRDLKPANIMIGADDEALIMDFGIARSTGGGREAMGRPGASPFGAAQAAAGATVAGEIVGTVEYMAPEQARGETADQRADVYAFGLILYDMLLGRRRHTSAASAIAELRARIDQPPPPPRTLDENIPEPLDRIIVRCLAPKAEERYADAQAIAADLALLDDEGHRLPSSRRTIHLTIAGAVVLVLAMFGVNWWLAGSRKPAPTPAPVPLLIADFQNPTGDRVFEGTLEPALSVVLEGASFITSFNRNEAKKLAATLKPDSPLDAEVARLIAVREGIKVVVSGAIESSGSGYAVTVRAVDAADGRQVWAARTTASERARVLPAVGRLAADLRKALGDTSSAAARMAAAETFTTASLDAMKEYSLAQELAVAGRDDEAIRHFENAVRLDPKFGRAYAGWATSEFYRGRKEESADRWKQALALMDGMTEREKYRTLGTYYLLVARNYEKAIENYSTLVRLYPTDLSGHNNLALAHFNVLDFAKAREEGDKARALYPRNAVIAGNSALYAMYAGDFTGAAERARELVQREPGYYTAYLPLAVAALASGSFDDARAAYASMAGTGRPGQSLATIGLADVDSYTGGWTDVEKRLRPAIAEDEKGKELEAAGVKHVALAEALEAMGRKPAAIDEVNRALAVAQEPATLVPAARLLLRLGREAEARAILTRLENQIAPQSRAYAKVLEGEIALANGRFAAAVDAFQAATKLADFWIARFLMGIAYVQAGHYAEGLGELEACQRRRGEASAMFLDDTPTFRILATLPYWLGRAQAGVGQQAAASGSFQAFLSLRPSSPRDPLVIDATARLQKSPAL